jgi:hypothetical protein
VLAHTVGDCLDFGGRAHRLIGCQTTFRVNEMGSEDGVDQGRLSETRLTLT